MSIGSPLASASDDASACDPSWFRAPTACLRADPKSAPAGWPAPGPATGRRGESGERPPILLIGIQNSSCYSGAAQVDRSLGHLLDRIQHRYVGLVGPIGRQHVGHLGGGVDVGIRDQPGVRVSVRVSGVVHLAARRLVLDDGRNLQPIARRARTLVVQWCKDDLLALIRLALAVDPRGLSVGDIARDDVHAQALGGKRRARDAHAAEETHAGVPAFPLVKRSVRQAPPCVLGRRVPVRPCERTGYSGTPTASSRPSFLIAGLVTVNRITPEPGAVTYAR